MQAVAADIPGQMHAKMLSGVSCNMRTNSEFRLRAVDAWPCQLHIPVPHLNRTIHMNRAEVH